MRSYRFRKTDRKTTVSETSFQENRKIKQAVLSKIGFDADVFPVILAKFLRIHF